MTTNLTLWFYQTINFTILSLEDNNRRGGKTGDKKNVLPIYSVGKTECNEDKSAEPVWKYSQTHTLFPTTAPPTLISQETRRTQTYYYTAFRFTSTSECILPPIAESKRWRYIVV